MAKYTVQMTFETPAQRALLKSTQRLPGRASSLQMLGSEGSVAVTASRVSADSPAEAATIVVQAVTWRWQKSRGPIILRSWTAHRERVLLGSRRGNSSVWLDSRPWDEGDEGGAAGVREPRRPLPGPGSLQAERPVPGSP